MKEQHINIPEEMKKHLDEKYSSHIPVGWKSLVEELHTELVAVDEDYKLTLIKEKFGVLVIYVEYIKNKNPLKTAIDVMRRYEQKSSTVCMECSSTDGIWGIKSKDVNWLVVNCLKCQSDTFKDNRDTEIYNRITGAT